jgi:hypothetical protein
METKETFQNTISKSIANLNRLMIQLDEWKFIDQDFYENYEFEILHFSIALANIENDTTFKKLDLIKEMAVRQDDYKNKIEETGKYVIADGARATEFQFLEKNSLQKKQESMDDTNKSILNAYRRYGEVIKSRLISEMADLKRLDTLQKSQNQ